jgi:DDE superfamily endonuclease
VPFTSPPPTEFQRTSHSAPEGEILWVSGPLPGSVHDLTAARIWGVVRELAAAGLVVLADKGYLGAGDPVITPYRGRNKPASQKDANRAHAKLRAPGERANAQLIPEGAGRVKRWCVRVRDDFRVGHGHTKAARGGAMPEGPGPGGAPVTLAAAGLGERPGWVKDRAGPAGGAGAGGVLDAGRVRADDRAPRGEQGLCGCGGCGAPSAVRVLAGGLAALIPSGRPAAPGRGAWGWFARAAGSIKTTAAPPGGGGPS